MTVFEPFWDGVAHNVLRLQYDPETRSYQFWPRLLPLSGNGSLEWREASGRGRVFAFTIMPPGAPEGTPLVFAAVDLNEGVRIMAPLQGIGPERVQAGMAVRVAFPGTEGAPPYVFEPDEE